MLTGSTPFRLACDGARVALSEPEGSARILVHANDESLHEESDESRNWMVLLVLLVPPAAILSAVAAIWSTSLVL